MGLHLIPNDLNINFVGYRYAFVVSAILILVGVASLFVKGGPRYGIDFEGGVVVQVKFDQSVKADQVEDAARATGLPGIIIQRLGIEADNEFLVRSSATDVPSETIRSTMGKSFTDSLPGVGFSIQRLEIVGPKVGADLRSRALEALYYAVLLIAIYISGRFEHRWLASAVMAGGLYAGMYLLGLFGVPTGWLIFAALMITLGLCWYLRLAFALGAVVALIHDVAITIGIFSLLDKELDLTVIAALLTLLGFSLNDTIIVFDRIRESLKNKAQGSLERVINLSINQTLSRTIITSGLTFVVVLALYLFGGSVINDFALALLIGIVVGTYSSIFIASPILLWLKPQVPSEAVKAGGGAPAKASV